MAHARNYVVSTVSCTDTASEVVGVEDSRKVLILFNQDASNDINIYLDTTSGSYFTLGAGEGMTFDYGPMNSVKAICNSGETATLTVWEA